MSSLLPKSLWTDAMPLSQDECEQLQEEATAKVVAVYWLPLINLLKDSTKLYTKIKKKKVPGSYKISDGKDYIKQMISNHLSSSNETRYGNWLQFIAQTAAKKRFDNVFTIGNLDYSFMVGERCYNLEIKTSYNWGNSAQWKQLANDFSIAEKQYSHYKSINLLAHAGMEESKVTNRYCENHYILEGPDFWHFQTGHKHFYKHHIDPIFDSEICLYYREQKTELLSHILAA